MLNHERIFENFLKTKSLKLTKPRKIILEEVFKNHGHFNVDILFDQIRNKHDNVSRATIYRTMPLLVGSGLIKQSLRCQAKDHYEHIHGHPSHLHLICVKCGRIIEVPSKEIETILLDVAQEKDFTIKEFNIGAKGICKRCRKK
ncbi:MAG TPA: transcriptional repressor [Candidatus Cloacimonetes bacterium]|nr:transcriptional repressor [Candidatus Cloacimonadota bacterium]